MSNARYFAQGTDFWRVKYDWDDLLRVDGPYMTESSARRRLKRMTNPDRYGFKYESGVVQKLSIVKIECNGESPCIKAEGGCLCFGHGSKLDWVDV